MRIRDPQNNDAWEEFTSLYETLVKRFCAQKGLQDADARDVAQNVMSKVCTAIRTFDYDCNRGRFRGWLGVMTRNAIIDFQRSRQRQKHVGDDALTPAFEFAERDVGSEWNDLFNAEVLKHALERVRPEFSEQTWTAFHQVWIDHRKPRLVATEMSQPPQWVYQQTYLVTSRLKKEICFLADDVPHIQRDS